MDTITGHTTLSKSENHISLQISTPTPHSSRLNTTTQEPPYIAHTPAGDIPPPQFINSITELRSFSTALSEFLSRYDELQNYISFINSSIDSILPNHIVAATNPNQSALTHLLETVNVSLAVTESDHNPKQGTGDCERSCEFEKKTDSIGFSQNFEEVDNLTKSEADDASKNHEEIYVCTNTVKIDASKKFKFADASKCNEESYVSKRSLQIGTSKKPEFVDVSGNSEEIDAVKKSVEIDASKMCELTDLLENIEEIVESKKHAETDTSRKPEETVPDTSYDQTLTVVPEQNPQEIGTDCKQIYENVQMPENLEDIDVPEKFEQTDIMNKREEITEESDVLQNPEAINPSVNHEEIDLLHNPEEFDSSMEWEEIYTLMNAEDDHTSKNNEEIDMMKKPEQQTDICKKPEETGICKKSKKSRKKEKTETSKKYIIISALKNMCQTMSANGMKRHIARHYSKMNQLHNEITMALKLAKDPAKLVLNSLGKFYVQRSRTFRKDSGEYLQRLASVLILECFVMTDDIEIAKEDQKYAAEAAVDWRNWMVKEGGLSQTDEIDARGLLFLIRGFGVPDHVFKIQDIVDLIKASNVKGLHPSVFLALKIPEFVDLIVKSNLEIEAADIAYTLGLEDKCNPKMILKNYLDKKVKRIQNASYNEMLEANKQQLSGLKSVKQCLESHNIDPTTLLPDFDEKIQNLEIEINETKLIQKRKSLENPIHHESKRARAHFSHENMPHQQKPVDHYVVNPYNPLPQSRPTYDDYNMNRYHSYSNNYNPRLAGAYPGSYGQMVHPANGQVQPYYGWHESYGQHHLRYDPQFYSRPRGWGPP